MSVETGTWVVPARHAIWLPPHHMHSGRMGTSFTGWSLYLATSACANLPTLPCMLAISPLLWEVVQRSSQWGLDELDDAQTRLALVIVDELRSLKPQPLGLALPQDARLLRIAHALLANPADRRGLDAWAQWAGLSSRTLSRRFVAETSLSFTEWGQRVRLMRALEMLASDSSVTAVALDLGYSSVSAFITLFRRTFGVTPAVYFDVQEP
jgi:AraC-like DNA-binding protein